MTEQEHEEMFRVEGLTSQWAYRLLDSLEDVEIDQELVHFVEAYTGIKLEDWQKKFVSKLYNIKICKMNEDDIIKRVRTIYCMNDLSYILLLYRHIQLVKDENQRMIERAKQIADEFVLGFTEGFNDFLNVRVPSEIKKDIKHEKNPMRLKQLNKELNDSYKKYKRRKTNE